MVTKLNKMTLEQLEALIDERVEQKLQEILGDPDEGLELKPDVVKRLQKSLASVKSGKRGIPLSQVAGEFGLE